MDLTVVIDSVDPDALVPFWSAALGYRPLDAGLADFRVLVPADARDGAPTVLLQRVPEARPPGKNRVHLDVHPPDVPAHVAHLLTLGGEVDGPPVTALLEQTGLWWQVVRDGEGNTLCVVADRGHAPPAPSPSSSPSHVQNVTGEPVPPQAR